MKIMRAVSPDLLKALSADTRIQIIEMLKSRGQMCVSELAQALQLSSSAVSQHLRVLRQVGLVSNHRKGFWIPYAVNRETLEQCRRMFHEICTCGCKDEASLAAGRTEGEQLRELLLTQRNLEKELRRIQKEIAALKARQ